MPLSKSLLWASSALSPAALGFVSLFAGCKEEVTGPDCEAQGGVLVEVDGSDPVCEERCDPSKCIENNVCVGNRCRLLCTAHTECYSLANGEPETQSCTTVNQDSKSGVHKGAEVQVCLTSPKVQQIGLPCPTGTECGGFLACPDGTPCDGAGAGCAANECKPLVCRTTGMGDADAYCTSADCTADEHCPGGYYCGVIRLSQKICGTNKGDDDPCLAPSEFTANAATYQEGPVSLLRNACLKRQPCAPCAGPLDCSLRGDMDCVQIGQTTHCAKTCGDDDDCPDDYQCAGGYCIPRQQSCTPPPTDNFCWSCLDDLDCGPAGSSNTVACEETNEGQFACFDTAFPDTCTDDMDCPRAPDPGGNGLYGECLDEGEGLSPADSVYHRCYLPFLAGPGKFQCWRD